MNKDRAIEQIEKEFATATQARKAGNDGKVRVCARRAAGVAITLWLKSHSRERWGADAMNQLENLKLDESMPQSVRDAAVHLTTKITQQITAPFSTDPVQDSRIIIDYLLESINEA